MARVLVHYDIHDGEFRQAFQNKITADFNPKFRKITESVYCAWISTTPGNVNTLRADLQEAASGAPSGSRIFLEWPADGPNIEQIIIV
jgi:hypothetical protein